MVFFSPKFFFEDFLRVLDQCCCSFLKFRWMFTVQVRNKEKETSILETPHALIYACTRMRVRIGAAAFMCSVSHSETHCAPLRSSRQRKRGLCDQP
jgi:hypothetical protein